MTKPSNWLELTTIVHDYGEKHSLWFQVFRTLAMPTY